MSIGTGLTASAGAYTLSGKSQGQMRAADPAHQAAKTQAKIVAAQQALADANGVVDQDKRNHSPGCVACDQKLVDKAQAQLAQIKASAGNGTEQTPPPPGSTVDFTI